MTGTRRHLAAALLSVCLALGCLAWAPAAAAAAAGPRACEAGAAGDARRDCIKPWTVLVYMMADGDLAPYAFWDLYEMEAGFKSGREAAGSTRRSDLVVQLAAPGLPAAQRIHIMQQQEELYDDRLTLEDFKRRGLKDVRSPVVGTVPREEGGKPVRAASDLESFVEWGIRQYPSEHIMVVVWGHGQGWGVSSGGAKSALAGRRFGGLAFSDAEHTFLDIPSLHEALSLASQRALDGRPIDVYASDACLMQMVEVAAEISDSARFIAGSSQVENYLGLPYRRMMFELNTNRFSGERARPGVAGSQLVNDEPYLLARMLPRIFRMSLEPNGLHGRPEPQDLKTVTMSSLSSDELRGALVPALGELARALKDYLTEDPLRAISVTQVLQQAPSFMGGSRELGGFLRLLKTSLRDELAPATGQPASAITLRLSAAADQASNSLDRTVVAYALGTQYTGQEDALYVQGFRAVALWLPISAEDFSSRIADFSSSLFYRQQGGDWAAWLGMLFGH